MRDRTLPSVGLTVALALAPAMVAAETTPELPPMWRSTPQPEIGAGGGGVLAPFILAAAGEAHDRALSCLTTAVYYEAATEPRDGQEAVAQVVLNRVRHPAYPKSVCGVVYQGVAEGGSCQFTFACDGSTDRAPVPRLWRAAEDVAAAALAGRVSALAGVSTHYHAAWAHPYWRSSLVETGRIGGQVFYRLPGPRGAPRAFTGVYSGAESAAPPVRIRLAANASAPAQGRSRRRVIPPTDAAPVMFSAWGIDIASIHSERGAIHVRAAS